MCLWLGHSVDPSRPLGPKALDRTDRHTNAAVMLLGVPGRARLMGRTSAQDRHVKPQPLQRTAHMGQPWNQTWPGPRVHGPSAQVLTCWDRLWHREHYMTAMKAKMH